MSRLLKDLDSIQASQSTKDQTLDYVFSSHKKRNQKQLTLGFIILATLILLVFIPTQKTSSTTAFITMDINPSFEFEINQDYKIINIKEYNDDGKKIIDQQVLTGQQLNNALISLLSNQEYSQYLKTGILEISVFSKNQQFSSEVEKYMNNQLKVNQVEQYHCTQIDETTHNNANQHHISAGRYQVIQIILSYTKQYTQEQLISKSMKKLYNILEDLNPEELPQNHNNQRHHNSKHK